MSLFGHPYLDHPGPIAFAHRGAHGPGAGTGSDADPPGENTLAAFQTAVDLGFRYVETDVHATVDGVLVAFHDDRLDRVTDRQGAISELTWDEVSSAVVVGGGAIPRFDELVTAFPDLRINVDPKTDAAVGPLMSAIDRHRLLDRVCVGSFSDRRLTALRERFGEAVCLGMGPRQVVRLRFASWRLPRLATLGHCAQVPLRNGPVPIVDDRFVAAAHERGIAVHVWTVDDDSTMHQLLDMGVDGVMTDRADTLVDVMRNRGLWPS